MKEIHSNSIKTLPRSAKIGLTVAGGAAVGGLKGSLGSLMSDKGTMGSGFVEGAAYGGAGTALTVGSLFVKDAKSKYGMVGAGLGIMSAALFATRIW